MISEKLSILHVFCHISYWTLDSAMGNGGFLLGETDEIERAKLIKSGRSFQCIS